jgi:hypothetical protein
MITKYKELVLKSTDCIRFLTVNSIEELNEFIEFIIQNKIDMYGQLSTLHLIENIISKSKDKLDKLPETFYLYFISLLPEILTNPLHQQYYHYIAEIILKIILPHVPENEIIENLVLCTHQKLRGIRRESIYLEERKILNKFCDMLEKRFPNVRKQIEEDIAKIKRVFFQTDLDFFLSKHQTVIQSFKIKFPSLYNIFLLPLNEKNNLNLPLYLFLFEKIFYRPIFLYLDSNKKSATCFHTEHLETLENAFKKVFSSLEEIDKEHLTRKFSGLIDSFKGNNISTTADVSWGLYGEIRGLQELVKEIDHDMHQMEIPDDQNKDNGGKVCDVRVWKSNKKSCQLFECKCKIPGYGYDGIESSLNDYLLNYIPLFSCFIRMCAPEINTLKYFPNFSFLNELSYGNLSEYTNLMINKKFRANYSYKDLRDPTIEKSLLEDIISCFFEEDFVISLGYQLPSEQTLVEIKRAQAKLLLEKEFLKNTLKKSLKQFRDEDKRLKETDKAIEKFVICWTLTIPQDLIDSPFFQLANSSSSLRKNIENQIQEMLKQLLTLEEFVFLKNQNVELRFF